TSGTIYVSSTHVKTLIYTSSLSLLCISRLNSPGAGLGKASNFNLRLLVFTLSILILVSATAFVVLLLSPRLFDTKEDADFFIRMIDVYGAKLIVPEYTAFATST